MTKDIQFTPAEERVVELLMQGKTNKEMAVTLNIAIRTVESHLHEIYKKLSVSNRVEAVLALRKTTTGYTNAPPVESTIVEKDEPSYDMNTTETITPASGWSQRTIIFIIIGIGLALIITVLLLMNNSWTYQREAEFPDESTVGQTLDRSRASGARVHGQFGAASEKPWSAKSGFVKYTVINIPKTAELYLQIHYSKFNESTVSILIFIDDEQEPRAVFLPQNTGDWNTFTWSEAIPLGKFEQGTHSIKFSTNGQAYGVADLDQFTLTTKPP